MKRQFANLGIAITLGFFLNCCVAFTCVLIAQSRGGIVQRMTSEDETALSHRYHHRLFVGTTSFQGNNRLDNFGYREFKMGAVAVISASDGSTEFAGQLTVSEIDAGWPFKSFRRTAFITYPLEEAGRFLDQYTAFGPSARAPQFSVVSQEVDGFLFPARPLWKGFAVNTASYAALLWMLIFFPGILRRAVRARRGLCIECAYPVGVNERCTECGAKIGGRTCMKKTTM